MYIRKDLKNTHLFCLWWTDYRWLKNFSFSVYKFLLFIFAMNTYYVEGFKNCKSEVNTKWKYLWYYVVVQWLSPVWLFEAPWTAAHQASLSFTVSRSLLRLLSVESLVPSNHLILCGPLLLLPSIFPSIKVFSSELAIHIRWPKYWSFSFTINSSNEYSGLVSFRIDRFDRLAVQGTLKRLLQHHTLKASILWCSTFLMVQLSPPYMTIGKKP